MAVVSSRRSVMTLFSDPLDVNSHRARIVLLEKNIAFEVINADPKNFPDELIDFNPYRSLPTLVDRDLVIYDARIIMEYLDERFPHPPLLPVDPVARARTRVMLFRMERDWYSLLPALEIGTGAEKDAARKQLRDAFVSIAPVFQAKPFFMSDEFSMIDCSIAPLLWRFAHWGIELPPHAKPVKEYAERVYKRSSFKASLSDAEKDLKQTISR